MVCNVYIVLKKGAATAQAQQIAFHKLIPIFSHKLPIYRWFMY